MKGGTFVSSVGQFCLIGPHYINTCVSSTRELSLIFVSPLILHFKAIVLALACFTLLQAIGLISLFIISRRTLWKRIRDKERYDNSCQATHRRATFCVSCVRGHFHRKAKYEKTYSYKASR